MDDLVDDKRKQQRALADLDIQTTNQADKEVKDLEDELRFKGEELIRLENLVKERRSFLDAQLEPSSQPVYSSVSNYAAEAKLANL